MKISRVFVNIEERMHDNLKEQVVVLLDGSSVVAKRYPLGNPDCLVYELSERISVQHTRTVIESIVIQSLIELHYENDLESAALFDLVEYPLHLIRLANNTRCCVRYETMIKFDILNNQCAYIGQKNRFGIHDNLNDLFVQNAFRVDNVTV